MVNSLPFLFLGFTRDILRKWGKHRALGKNVVKELCISNIPWLQSIYYKPFTWPVLMRWKAHENWCNNRSEFIGLLVYYFICDRTDLFGESTKVLHWITEFLLIQIWLWKWLSTEIHLWKYCKCILVKTLPLDYIGSLE